MVYVLPIAEKLVETICHSEIVNPNVLSKKLSQKEKKEKITKCGWNISVEMTDRGEIRVMYGRFACVEIFFLELHHCLEITESF